jgi:N-acetylmuramoyl-L-alanine amidase
MSGGEEIFQPGAEHLGEPYILGARAPLANVKWSGPWDCVEPVSWCVYQATRIRR